MKTLLVLLAVIVVLGVALGWFKFSSRSDHGHANVTLSVDKDKMVADKDKVVDQVQDLGHKADDKIVATTRKALN